MAYYKIAKDAAIESYKRKVSILKRDDKESQKLIAQMQVDFNQEIKSKDAALTLLQEQLEKVEKRAHELADKWVTINLDDQSNSYQRAFRAFQEKNIELAITILDSVDLENRLKVNSQDIIKIDTTIAELTETRRIKNHQKIQDIQQAIFKAELHELNDEYAQAEHHYKLAVKYDSTNFNNLWTLNSFLHDQNQSDSLILYAQKMLQIAEDEEEKGIALEYLGLGFHDQTQDSLAISSYEKALGLRRKLAQANPDRYESDVAGILNNLGNAYRDLNRFAEAISSYEEALGLYRNLAQANPDRYESYVAQTLNNLGNAYRDLNRFAEAISSYKEALGIRRNLAQANPDRYESDVASTLNNLGNAYSDLNRYAEAISSYEEALVLYRNLAQANPDRYESYVALTLNNLGNAYSDLNRFAEAISSYEEALGTRRNLAQANL